MRMAAERAALEQAAAEAGEALEDVSVAGEDELTTGGSGGALDDDDEDDDDAEAGVRVLARFKVNKMDCVSVRPPAPCSVPAAVDVECRFVASAMRCHRRSASWRRRCSVCGSDLLTFARTGPHAAARDFSGQGRVRQPGFWVVGFWLYVGAPWTLPVPVLRTLPVPDGHQCVLQPRP